MIAGLVKAFNFTIEYVMYGMSFANAMMYSSVLPSYKSRDKKKGDDKGELINADDPKNNGKVMEVINSFE